MQTVANSNLLLTDVSSLKRFAEAQLGPAPLSLPANLKYDDLG